MNIKVIKRNFSFDEPYFDYGNYRYQISRNRYISTYKSYSIPIGDTEPIIIDTMFIQVIRGINDTREIPHQERPSISNNFPLIYFYKNNLYGIDRDNGHTDDEIILLIKEHYYKHNEKFRNLQKEIQLFENMDTQIETMSREPIPEQVRFSVWRRDEGKCVKCGSNKNLEFDHIIPFSKGGSNSERNLQLLCEKCNREKSNKI